MQVTAVCPRCKSPEISRSRRRKLTDFLMRIFALKPFRCRECRSRFYLSSAYEHKVNAQEAWLRSVQKKRLRRSDALESSRSVRSSGR